MCHVQITKLTADLFLWKRLEEKKRILENDCHVSVVLLDSRSSQSSQSSHLQIVSPNHGTASIYFMAGSLSGNCLRGGQSQVTIVAFQGEATASRYPRSWYSEVKKSTLPDNIQPDRRILCDIRMKASQDSAARACCSALRPTHLSNAWDELHWKAWRQLENIGKPYGNLDKTQLWKITDMV